MYVCVCVYVYSYAMYTNRLYLQTRIHLYTRTHSQSLTFTHTHTHAHAHIYTYQQTLCVVFKLTHFLTKSRTYNIQTDIHRCVCGCNYVQCEIPMYAFIDACSYTTRYLSPCVLHIVKFWWLISRISWYAVPKPSLRTHSEEETIFLYEKQHI